MISESSLKAYMAAGFEGDCSLVPPVGMAMISFPDGKTYMATTDETDEEFLDRLERSKKAGRDLIREEWELDYLSRGIDVCY